ncbi:MAG: cation:proton antiporter [Micavibrio aeruginosavorus]|uniref:Cation:proton antiporter n=1 Tax=Micavibrio aeruginosavorus TaxID=349221 RepID=A0A7T5R2M1_9BACT|nr:MAG: cation:proton antiporter [Micavibrio aeruginosavorus]
MFLWLPPCRLLFHNNAADCNIDGVIGPVPMHPLPIKEIIVFLVVAGVLVPVLARLRLNPVLAFLLIGVLIGPYGLAGFPGMPAAFSAIALTEVGQVRVLGEFGIVFLLFLIGIELSPTRLIAMRRLIFGLGSAQVLLCGTVIGLIAWGWGNEPDAAFVLGACLALSSTAVVMKIVTDRGHFASPSGQASFAILLFQDLAIVPMMFLLAFAGHESAVAGQEASFLLVLAKAAGAILAVLLVGHWLARPLLRLAAGGQGAHEHFMACMLLLLLLAAVATEYAGLGMALGAFLAGLVFAETEFRNQIEIDMEPFRGLFMGLFFMSVGMTVDVSLVVGNIFWLAASVVGLFALKAALITGLCLAFGLALPVAARIGITLGQAGEFALIIVGMALHAKILTDEVAQFMALMTCLTLTLTPAAYWLGEYCERILQKRSRLSAEDALAAASRDVSGHVVIAGFGRTGQAVARMLEENQISYLALDIDAPALDALRQRGKPVFFGDAGNPQALQKVRADKARAVVLALDNKDAARRAIATVRRFCPQVMIYARAHDESHADSLKRHGVSAVVLEIEGVSQYLARRVIEDMSA